MSACPSVRMEQFSYWMDFHEIWQLGIIRKFCRENPTFINPKMSELNPSAQRCLTIIFTGNLAPWTVHFVKTCVKNQQMQQLFIQFINYVWYLLHVSALHCHHQGAFLVPSERCSIEEQSIEYCGWVTSHNTPIHNILSTAPQLIISQKALGMLPGDGNVMPKRVGDTIHN
jgi:hypothetical protein